MSDALEGLELRLGHTFADRRLLVRALTHKSVLSDGNSAAHSDNEQLEFLGDSILGFLASELLVARCPDFPEGRLSKLKAHLVSAKHLYEVALRLELGRFLILGRGEELSGGREKRALLSDAVEALLAVIYLDGGIEPCRRFVTEEIFGGIRLDELNQIDVPVDAKSALQEYAQARRLPAPRYVIVREQGPEHAKLFTVEARIGKEWVSQAEGSSKKAAAQHAAEVLLSRLESQADSLTP